MRSDDASNGKWWKRGSGQVQLLARLLVAAEKRRTDDEAIKCHEAEYE